MGKIKSIMLIFFIIKRCAYLAIAQTAPLVHTYQSNAFHFLDMNKPVITIYCYLYEDSTASLVVDAAPNVARVYDPYMVMGTWTHHSKKRNQIVVNLSGRLNTKRWILNKKTYQELTTNGLAVSKIVLSTHKKKLLGQNQHGEKIFLEKKN